MTSEFLANSDGLNGVFNHSLPTHESSHGTHDDVTNLFAVNDHLDVVREQLFEFFEEPASPFINLFVVLVVVWPMLIIDVEFVVIMQVMRGRDDADQTAEMVFSDPNDLFLTANTTMVIAIAPGAFTYG